jgi:hypothetical protein
VLHSRTREKTIERPQERKPQDERRSGQHILCIPMGTMCMVDVSQKSQLVCNVQSVKE